MLSAKGGLVRAKRAQVTMKYPLLISPMALIRNSDAGYPSDSGSFLCVNTPAVLAQRE